MLCTMMVKIACQSVREDGAAVVCERPLLGRDPFGKLYRRLLASWRNRQASATILALPPDNLLINQALITQGPLDAFSMLALISMFWRLTTFRMGPADVPAASALLPTMMVMFLIVNVGVRVWLSSFSFPVALASSALIMVLWMALVYVLVVFKNVRERFLQTAIALLGVDTVITLLNVIPGGLSFLVAADAPINDLLRIMVLVLFVWDMLAKGAIYRESLNLGPMQGNLLAMCFAFGFTWLDITLFSPVTNP